MFLRVFYFVLLLSLTKSEFKRLDGKEQYTWSTYFSVDPKDCSYDVLLRKFPHLYGTDNDYNVRIGPPENFTVTHIEREALDRGAKKDYYYPGALITFYPPENGEERVTGYEIHLYKNKGFVCIVMDFTESNATSLDQVELELFPLYGLKHYQLTASSLPPYSNRQSTSTVDLVTGVFGSKKTEPNPPSANWHASVAYDVIDHVMANDTVRSVEIVFSRPPPEYNFQLFEIVLVPQGGSGSLDIRKARTSNLYHIFEDITVGSYTVMMWPVDEYFSHPGRCLCRQGDGSCSNCVATGLVIDVD